MANKKRISEITKEIVNAGADIANKDVIAFLEASGIEGKKPMSSVEPEEEEMIKKHFLKKGSAGSDAAAKKTDKEEVKKEVLEGAKAEAEKPQVENKTPVKKPAPAQGAAQSAALNAAQSAGSAHAPAQGAPGTPGTRPAGAPGVPGQPPKKKKNIIFTVNNSADRRGGMRQSGNISSGRIQSGGIPGRGIIKPNVKPSPTPTVNIIRPGDQQNKRKFVHQEPSEPARSDAAGSVKPETKEAPAASAPEASAADTAVRPAVRPAEQTMDRGGSHPVRGQGAPSGVNRGSGERKAGNVYVKTNQSFQNNRQGSAGPDRDNRGNRNSQDRYGSGQRPGSKAPAFGRNNSFEAAPSEKGDGLKHRSDADRRKQNDIRRRKEEYERRDEEKERKKFNPHGFKKPAPAPKPKEEEIKVIVIPDTLTIKELADHMKMQPSVIIKKLFLSGQVVTVNSELSYEEAENIAADYDILCEQEKTVDVIAELLKEEPENEEKMEKRPPVVCVMGHVDHGKTSLLDYIRKAHVTDKEAGGITQAIGAYTVNIKGSNITFLDTPGHEAFTAMRMRGANATDIVILVVAADDGVMPQTVEAINHAKAAGVEIIVAVNKIDKPNANIDRVKQELSEYELISEDWGGSTTFVPVSAKTGQGIDDLLEMILLEADVMELKANPRRQARGMVIEAELDKGRGAVATVLVQKGVLHVGDFVACGMSHGRVRAMIDDKGRRVKEAGPSMPVEILGLDEVPEAGEIFVSPKTEKEAQEFANTYNEQHKKELLSETRKKSVSLDDIYSQIKEGDLKEFNIIIKADVQGSVEALKTSLLKLSNEEIAVKVIHGGVGAINESDVVLASASNAIIIGFNVRPDNTAKQMSETENVDIHLYKVIYQALEDVEAAMKGMLGPVYEEKIIGHGEIRQVFKASGIGKIAGSYVTDGIVERGCSVKITRGDEELFDGPLSSLKRFKDDVKEVREGYECGLVFEGFDSVEEGDILEFHKTVEVERS